MNREPSTNNAGPVGMKFRISTLLWLCLVCAAFCAGRFSRYEDPPKLLPGQLGIDTLLQNRMIRIATKADADRWLQACRKAGVSANPERLFQRIRNGSAYVALQQIQMPDDLFGANSCALIIPVDVQFPTGPRCHNDFYCMDGSMLGPSASSVINFGMVVNNTGAQND